MNGPQKTRVFAVLIFLVSGVLQAQDYVISETNFLPQKYYVGDQVELRLVIRTLKPEEIRIPASFPSEDWLVFEEIQVHKHHEGAEIRIVFRSFFPGTRTLPPVNFDSFVLNKVKIHTSSILSEKNTGFGGPRKQLFLPGTRIAIVVLVFIFLIVPLFALFLAGRVRRWARKMIAQQRERKPIKRFYRGLDELKKQAGRMSSREFYIILTNSLRKYLSIRSGKDYQTITTREIGKQIKTNFPGIHHLNELVDVLKYGDEIKFSPKRSSYYKEIRDIDLILRVVTAIEDSISGRKGKDEVSVFHEKEYVE
ncbi:MAG: hypothetical protein JW874_13920 [Spirochaetales bacterium]|nr:hypothetical protein [Spirochaetales bacterium]